MPRTGKAPAGRRRRRPAWSLIRLFAMDVDGVLTDGTVLTFSDGREAKVFSILDGMGIARLLQSGVSVAWISGRPSDATVARARELRIPHLIQGRNDKVGALRELAGRLGLGAEACAYMGDDIIDIPAIEWAGIGIAPAGAIPEAIEAADFVPELPAGRGAVRAVCERILAARRGGG